MIDLLPDGVIRLDADRRIVEVNAAAADLTGRSAGELLGQVVEILKPRSRDRRAVLGDGWHPSAHLRSVKGFPEQEVILLRPDGKEVRAWVSGTYQRAADGSLQGAVLALRPAAVRSRQAATGIEIVSVVAHELRSPLTSVKGYTSLLLSRWDRLGEDDKKMMLEQVNHDADRVTRLITEVLDISRLESGRLVLRREMVEVPKLAESVVQKVRLEHPELDCDMEFPEPFPRVYVDPDKVMQVLTNLLENACKYASPVGIEVQGDVGDEEVSVAVRDRGPGLPEHDLNRVFTKFFRRGEARPTGSGLGLWISKGLVEAHGGYLMAQSTPGRGSTFRFTLPRRSFENAHA